MGENSLKKKVVSSMFWAFSERVMAQGISFVLSIIIARLLMPSDYGIIALVIVFINLANVFVSTGIGESLIQKKDADDMDFSTVFYCSLVLSLFLYVILFLFAPDIGHFYRNDELIWVLRSLALIIPITSIGTVQQAYVSKKMLFKKFFFSTLGGTIISGLTGVLMAYCGLGMWSLVAQYLINSLVNTIVLFFIVKWRPKLLFSINSAKALVGFGWKLVAANFINTTYGELRSLIIGKYYTMADLAYYNRGNQLPGLLITNIDTAIGKVVFPVMAESNDDIFRLKSLTSRAMKTTSYIIFPLMIGLMSVAHSLILFLLTEKWLFSVPYLQICCVYWLFQPMQTANWQAIKALGRSDLLVRLEIIKKIIGISMLLVSMNISVYAIVVSNAIFAGISMIINMIPNKKLMNYTMMEQFRDLAPSLALSVVMGGSIYTITWIHLPVPVTLLLQILCGVVIYVGGSFVLKLDSFKYLSGMVSKTVKTRSRRVSAKSY
ncbi:lipopolysaccharide biosynthesis protein [Paenibacillus aestuarii]|uniref:Lipopolysaccharide biosynthesis protein n=1 Tax=Paenibacillus aestuarii TaxID=516965 RepID=A0ABW0K2K2_9BACL|nr:lipopolysaccharide biosynthesis protein [Paenibacillus aestuarii]